MKFQNKVAVITGGANGIGKCIVEEFKKVGARVAVIDQQDVGCAGDLFFCGDIAHEQTLHTFCTDVIDAFGGVDYLINNACMSKRGILSSCSYDDFVYVQKVGVVAPYLLAKLLLPHFNDSAAIVNICSTRAFASQPDTESYSAAKGGIFALTHALAISLSGRVRVNAISPGWIDTAGATWSEADCAQHPVKRIGHTADIANMALYLCSDAASFITGQNITIDGGMSKQMIYHGDGNWKFES